jgi:hypothetical protein
MDGQISGKDHRTTSKADSPDPLTHILMDPKFARGGIRDFKKQNHSYAYGRSYLRKTTPLAG